MKVPEKYRVKSGPLSTTVEDGNKPGFSFLRQRRESVTIVAVYTVFQVFQWL